MDENKKNGGLYAKVKMSVKTADVIILIGLIALVACTLFGIGTAETTQTDSETSVVETENQNLSEINSLQFAIGNSQFAIKEGLCPYPRRYKFRINRFRASTKNSFTTL